MREPLDRGERRKTGSAAISSSAWFRLGEEGTAAASLAGQGNRRWSAPT